MRDVLDFLRELIEGGFIAQAILASVVWGAIGFLAVKQQPVPSPLLDAGFTILGFYFRALMSKPSSKITSDK